MPAPAQPTESASPIIASVNRIDLRLGYKTGRAKSKVINYPASLVPLTLNLSDTLSLSDYLQLSYTSIGLILKDTLSLTEGIVRLGYGLHFFDTLSFSDSLKFFVPTELIINDTLLLIESLRLGYGLHLFDSITLSDLLTKYISADIKKVLTGETLSQSDAISTFLNVNKFITINDDITTLQEAITSLALSGNVPLALGDTINNQLDSLKFSLGRLIKLSDQLSQNDLFKIQPIAAVYLHDALTLIDHLALSYAHVSKSLMDNLSQRDQIYLFQPQKPAFNDSLNNYGDSLRPVLGINLGLHDQLVQADHIAIAHTQQISIGLNDGLTFTESLGIREGSITDDISYIRRYINDVVGIQSAGDVPSPVSEPPNPERDYLRRYLNDKT